jgi:hypothetical protein
VLLAALPAVRGMSRGEMDRDKSLIAAGDKKRSLLAGVTG